jgi:hypothetical protein
MSEAYHAFPSASPEQVERCMEFLRVQMARGGNGIFTDAFTTRRRRWWWGGVAAAALLVVSTLRPVRLNTGSDETADTASRVAKLAGQVTVVDGGGAIRFDLRLPVNARDVALVGDFNGWDTNANEMKKLASDGTWSVKIPLKPGMHTYAFVVDGQQWIVDPLAPQVPDNGFGPANAVVVGTD